MGKEIRPYNRSEYNRALIANALTSPFNVAIFAAMLIALPFMGDQLQGHMTRIAARIMGG